MSRLDYDRLHLDYDLFLLIAHSTFQAPENIKVPLAIFAYIAGMLGFAIKEALGGQTKAPALAAVPTLPGVLP